jgi:hypothetical protein
VAESEVLYRYQAHGGRSKTAKGEGADRMYRGYTDISKACCEGYEIGNERSSTIVSLVADRGQAGCEYEPPVSRGGQYHPNFSMPSLVSDVQFRQSFFLVSPHVGAVPLLLTTQSPITLA